MDLHTTINRAVERIVDSEVIEQAIHDQLAKTIVDIVQTQMRPYSNFGEQLGEKVGEALRIHGDIDLPSYNDALLKIMRMQLEERTHAVIQQQVASRMEDLLEPPPEEISISDLVEKYIEHLRSREAGGCVCYGERHRITCIVRQEGHTSGADWKKIGLSEEPDNSLHECDIQISTHAGKVWCLRFGHRDVEKQLFAGPFYGFERMLFQMKAAGSRIVFDVDPSEIETEWEPIH